LLAEREATETARRRREWRRLEQEVARDVAARAEVRRALTLEQRAERHAKLDALLAPHREHPAFAGVVAAIDSLRNPDLAAEVVD
jgi:hypothetical protein